MSRRGLIPHVELATAAQALALGAWLLRPALAWALVAFACGAVAAVLAARDRRGVLVVTTLIGLTGATTAGVTAARVRRVEQHWDDVKEQLIRSASRELAATLESTVTLARSLADRAAAIAAEPQADEFQRLARALPRGGPEAGVAILEADGRPRSWAGRHRLPLAATGRELDARMTPFYVVLEARRQTGEGRVAIGQVLVVADSSVPDGDRTMAARFTRITGAALQFFRPGRAPLRTDVFDYCLPSCAPGDTLFSIRTVPPAQGNYKLELLESGGRTVTLGALVCLIGLLAVGEIRSRYLALSFAAALFLFTPAGARANLASFFSPATYYLGAFDPFTASAGALFLTSVIVIVAIVALGSGRLRPLAGVVTAVVVALVAPLVARELGRGIAPPGSGVGVGVWLGWEIALAAPAAALVLLVAALLPRPALPRNWAAGAAAAWAVVAAILGIFLWQPGSGWPMWYGWIWLPAVFLPAQASRARQIVAAGLVGGSVAALLTWGAAIQGRLYLAEADARRVAGEGDPLALALLERIGQETEALPRIRTAGDLYRLWDRSPLSDEGYPAVLAIWSARGQPLAELKLADLDLPNGLIRVLAASAAERGTYDLEPLRRSNGAYAVLARPLPDGTVLTVGIGPRSRLISQIRIAGLLRDDPRAAAPYEMVLSETGEIPDLPAGLRWRREGQTVHGDERLNIPNGLRVLHIRVETGELPGLLVRGALVLFLDATILALLWLFGDALAGRTDLVGRLRTVLRLRSYRLRIAVALAVFFVVPTVGFAIWMAGRIQFDARRSDDLVIRQSLRDASAAFEPGGGPPPSEPLSALADRAGAELIRYESGAVRFGSAPLLTEMGLVDSYLPPAIYRQLMADEGGEAAGDMSVAGRRARTGFRAINDARGTVLAMPLLGDDRQRTSGEEDLGYALLLVTLVGLVAAGTFADVAARGLAEPVGLLRSAAESVGRGETPPPLGRRVPEEFTPVAEAFSRMVHDVQASQAALESARQRTVAVLRYVATGVIALNADLRVILANPRAEELLGRPLEPGADASVPLGDWNQLWEWVRLFVRSGSEIDGAELTVHGRRIRVRASAFGSESGCVVALDDVTELTYAIRVLAWGEIARQVAHEIKNPLTPMRLGIQHLLRVEREPRAAFDETLQKTSRQILSEIDRLDGVARAFARFGAPPSEEQAGPLAAVDVVGVARETAALYSLGGEGEVILASDGVVKGLARPDELREVLVNLVENARNAHASRIELVAREEPHGRVGIVVTDNGRGVRPEDLPRIFEPHFSTTTSGTGLGLAICKRLVNSWGGTIDVASRVGMGTTVTIELPAAE